jgi:hypothetical protein
MALVHRYSAAGDDVEVLSRPCTAAQYRTRLEGPRGAIALWWRARRFDSVAVTGDGLLRANPRWGPFAARVALLVDCLAWGLVFRVVRRPRLVVGGADALPGGVGGRAADFMWQPLAREVVEDAPRRVVRPAAPAPAGATPPAVDAAPPPPRWDEGWAGASDQATVEELVRTRAAAARRAAR